MKRILAFFTLCLFIAPTFSQHMINLKNHDPILGQRTNAGEAKYQIDIHQYANANSPIIDQADTVNCQSGDKNDKVKRSALTIGYLEGGGSLVGFDVEALLNQRVGIQFGLGWIGYGIGLNLHFKPKIRSSFLSLQYYHQGLDNTYVQSLVGMSFVYRAPKIFTASLGLGSILETGPAYPDDKSVPDVILTYAVGLYF